MNKGLLIGIGVFMAVIVFGLLFINPTRQRVVEVVSSNPPQVTEKSSSLDSTVDSEEESRTIQVFGEDFSFSPETISVKRGERIKISFTNKGEMKHDFIIEELDLGTKTLKSGESDSFEFTVPSSGDLTFYCSVGDHRVLGMEGKFVITE